MKTSKGRILGFFALSLALLCTLAIWRFSMEEGSVSGQRSSAITALLGHILHAALPDSGELILRKAAHFSEYALLGALCALSLHFFGKKILRHSMHVLFPCLLIAVLDETIQRYIPGRASSTLDVLIDFAGAAFGMIFAACVVAVRAKFRETKR